MAITFSSTRVGSNPDYSRYIYGNIKKTDRYQNSVLLDFALAPIDSSFVKLTKGSYITVDSTTYPKWFTGYITNEPELTYLGTKNGNPVWGYVYQATSDEYILNFKPLGIIYPFLNTTMGGILKNLITRILPGVFDLTNIQNGPKVAQYIVDPNKKFSDVCKEFCNSGSYLFYGNNHKLYFVPQNDISLPAITIDGNSKDFTPSRLTVKPSATTILNDVTALGEIEPQVYVQEYYLGTGLEASFPLTQSAFGVDVSVLLDESFSGSSIDTSNTWIVNDPTVSFAVANGYLNCIGGASDGTFSTQIYSINPFPMDGNLRLTHGEWDFVSNSLAYICGLWTQDPNSAATGLLYGLKVNGTTINPVVYGVVDTTQSITIDYTKRYIIRTIADFLLTNRSPQSYNYLDPSGVVQNIFINNKADVVTWQTIITEVDPLNGTLTNQWWFSNTSTLNGTTDIAALYAPIIADNLHATVTSITISIPLNATLELADDAPILNGSFDSWDDSTHPSGWFNVNNSGIAEESVWSAVSNDVKFLDTTGVIEQTLYGVIDPNKTYDIIFRAQSNPGLTPPTATLVIRVYGTGVDVNTFVTATELAAGGAYGYNIFRSKLVGPLTTIPSDLKLQLYVTVGGPIWVDSLRLLSEWRYQLVGPNDLDAMDGLTPAATIIDGNVGAPTVSTYFGTPQYNPGQYQLVFFKDSVTLTSDVPPANQLIHLGYRSAGAAVGRVKSNTSIASEAALFGDDGVRSIVRTDLTPRPRDSSECELAASVIVYENSTQHYDGTYSQYSEYFANEPLSGMVIKFVNLSSMADINAEEVNQVITTAVTSEVERFYHEVTFGKPDHLNQLLAKFENPPGAFQPTTTGTTAIAYPTAIDVSTVGTNYLPDVTKPVLQNWDDVYLYVDIGQDLDSSATNFEVRYTDDSWGPDPSKNLLVRQPGRLIQIPRNLRGRRVYIRQVNGSVTSRYSSLISVSFPSPNIVSGAIRDYYIHIIDTANPLVAGVDIADNRYRLTIDSSTYFKITNWTATLKFPTSSSGTASFDILKSSDSGATWISIFNPGYAPVFPVSSFKLNGNTLAYPNLFKDDLVRYDCLSTDGVAGGLEIQLEGQIIVSPA